MPNEMSPPTSGKAIRGRKAHGDVARQGVTGIEWLNFATMAHFRTMRTDSPCRRRYEGGGRWGTRTLDLSRVKAAL